MIGAARMHRALNARTQARHTQQDMHVCECACTYTPPPKTHTHHKAPRLDSPSPHTKMHEATHLSTSPC